MTRHHRLTHRRQFTELRRLRISATSGVLRVHAGPNGGLPVRAGYAISGIPNAVLRNRIRRRLRALVRIHAESAAGVDLLVSAGPGSANTPFTQLGIDLSACLTRVLPRVRPSQRSHGSQRSAGPPGQCLADNGRAT